MHNHTHPTAGRLERLRALLARGWAAYLASFVALGIAHAHCPDMSYYYHALY